MSNKKASVRTRFAPAPSGTIHLGNVRAALINLIFAKKMGGKFILRIEDTDREKVTQTRIDELLYDLSWLGIFYDEGPDKRGPHEPYFQSQRGLCYQRALEPFIANNKVYRCFCTKERLEEVRSKQIASRGAPRYDRFCLGLTSEVIQKKLDQKIPFVWRFFINHEQRINIIDLLRGELSFDLSNFTDFVISRSDGSFNFLFANFVDDVQMEISHVIRGEDHLSNSALQAALYQTVGIATPIFMHLPLILNEDGQKLSKSAQNFDLHSLRAQGFLPEAICCYLASLGSNLGDEPYYFSEILEKYDLNSLSAQSVRYELPKIIALNRKFIRRLTGKELLIKLESLAPEYGHFREQAVIEKILEYGRENVSTLQELATLCNRIIFGFVIDDEQRSLAKNLCTDGLLSLMSEFLQRGSETSVTLLQDLVIKYGLTKKEVFTFIRLACTGKRDGLTINQIFEVLPGHEILKRTELLLQASSL